MLRRILWNHGPCQCQIIICMTEIRTIVTVKCCVTKTIIEKKLRTKGGERVSAFNGAAIYHNHGYAIVPYLFLRSNIFSFFTFFILRLFCRFFSYSLRASLSSNFISHFTCVFHYPIKPESSPREFIIMYVEKCVRLRDVCFCVLLLLFLL